MIQIKIEINNKTFMAELNSTKTASLFAGRLPMDIELSRWGDEYYGDCYVTPDNSDPAKEIMEIGELAVWAPGKAFCIFFGKTPASTGDEPRAASAVVSIGKIKTEIAKLKPLGGRVSAKISVI